MQALRSLALRYPGAQEGIACNGNSLEKRTIKAGGKAFLFLGPRDAMLKLRDSLPEATRLARELPAGRAGKLAASLPAQGVATGRSQRPGSRTVSNQGAQKRRALKPTRRGASGGH